MASTKESRLQKAWKERLRFCTEGNKLIAEGSKISAEVVRLNIERTKLCAEGGKLCAEGNVLWVETILKELGSVSIEWKGPNCTVNGWTFKG